MPRSITTAADSGNGSLVKNVTVCLTLSSYTLKSVASRPSTILPSVVFHRDRHADEVDVHLQLEELIEVVARSAAEWFPAGTVLIPCEPGKGASGFSPGEACGWSPPDRVFGGDCGLSLDGAAAPLSSLMPGNRRGDVGQGCRRIVLRLGSIRQRLLLTCREGGGHSHDRQQYGGLDPSIQSKLRHVEWLISREPELSLSITATLIRRNAGSCFEARYCNTMNLSTEKEYPCC